MQGQSKNLKLSRKSVQDIRRLQMFLLFNICRSCPERKAKVVNANLQKNAALRVLLAFHLHKSLRSDLTMLTSFLCFLQNMLLDSAGLLRLIAVPGRRTRTLRPLGLLRSVRTVFGAKGREAVAHWQWAWLTAEEN